jgi:adenosylcobinamide kinase/adenosylcobinamide-phosphate guanylyltransferase
MPVIVVTGPVRSGKSRFALERAKQSGLPVTYVATAAREPGDGEWDARLERHLRERPAHWTTVESAELAAGTLLARFRDAAASECIIVDALGTWIAARFSAAIAEFERDAAAFEARLDAEAAALASALLASPALVIAVAEEVGWDVVPIAPSARVFRDVLGRMKQQLGEGAQSVVLLVCGIAVDLKALPRG